MIWINGVLPSPSFNQNNFSVGTHAELEPMIQSMRSRHTGFAKSLAALWFVLFFGCSLSHAHADTNAALADGTTAHEFAGQGLQTSACHAQLGLDGAAVEACNALQNSPLNQQLLMLLALAALLGLAGAVDLLSALPPRRGSVYCLTAIAPGLPTPLRKHLHRYNE